MCDQAHYEFGELMQFGYVTMDQNGSLSYMSKEIASCGEMLLLTPANAEE
jgi:hypothetical protein